MAEMVNKGSVEGGKDFTPDEAYVRAQDRAADKDLVFNTSLTFDERQRHKAALSLFS